MQTMSLKLVSGEEVIGRLVGESPGFVKLSHVRTIGLQQTQSGDYGIGMMDYILSNKDCVVPFKDSAIVAKFATDSEVAKAYLSNTTGIQL